MIIETKLLKQALTDLKKFLGNKVSPVSFRSKDDHLELSQFSPLASARVRIPYEKMSKPPKSGIKSAADSLWLNTSLSRSSDQTVEMTFAEGSTKIKFNNSTTSSANQPFEQLEDTNPETTKIPSALIKFVRENSKLLKMKSFFSNRPLAATIGTIDKLPFFMVNDQYHGFIVIGDETLSKKIEKFSMDAASAAAIAFDPNTVEDDQKLALSITEGRVYIHYPTVTYEVPAFEPSAVPSLEEIEEIVTSNTKYKKSHSATLNCDALDENMRLFKYKEDTQTFTVGQSEDMLRFQYSSATIDSDSKVFANDLEWPTKLTMDPSMFSEVVSVFSDYSKSKTNKLEHLILSKGRKSNILMMRGLPVEPVRLGFIILAE